MGLDTSAKTPNTLPEMRRYYPTGYAVAASDRFRSHTEPKLRNR